MAYNEELARRLRALLPNAVEKRMFGGMGLMEDGNLVAGASREDLIVRVPPEETTKWLREPGAHSMMPGKTMVGWVKVSATALTSERTLKRWVDRSRSWTKTLPPK
jgi:TfoX/Sxy family transcriptional regulator of competence genes